jgi:hypothetical protein
VNFYRATGVTARIQALTAESMSRAATRVRNLKLLAVTLMSERNTVPSSFKAAPPLRRTVIDVRRFVSPRAFPLLFDIISNGATVAKSDSYLILTNSDICVVPHFYTAIRSLLNCGFDCLIINRRTVPPLEAYGDSPELAVLEAGAVHPGFDCFVFPVEWVPDFIRNDACVGIGFVMRSLLFNLIARAHRMLILRDAHLTYHYGDDRPWNSPDFKDYTEHNVSEAKAVLEKLATDSASRENLAAFCAAHGEIYPDGSPIEV